jgi:hypothetical protein
MPLLRGGIGMVMSLALVASSASTALAQAADSDGDGLRDHFEERWGITDPQSDDSDGDGLVDSAEDDDQDGLSTLGEQRFGTDPGNPDSDADGTEDGAEDSDGDGLSDAREQDERRAPAQLRPAIKDAYWDRPPTYNDDCHSDQTDPRLRPCSYGDVEGDRTVVLFGDSHALQWLSALIGPAEEEGWQVVTLTKAACPPPWVVSSRKEPTAQASCDRWRTKALQWLNDNEPDVAILAGGGRLYNLVDDKGERIRDEARTTRWQQGLSQTLSELPAATAAIVMADTPYMNPNPATCLKKDASNLAACSTKRVDAIDRTFDQAERQAVEAAGATYTDLTRLVCPYSPCPVVVGDVLAYRNHDHITATFAAQLAPSMRAAIAAATGGDPVADTSPVPSTGPLAD